MWLGEDIARSNRDPRAKRLDGPQQLQSAPAIDEIFTEDCAFYDPKGGVYQGRDENDRIAGAVKAAHLDFRYQPIAEPEKVGIAGGSNGYLAALVRRRRTLVLISSFSPRGACRVPRATCSRSRCPVGARVERRFDSHFRLQHVGKYAAVQDLLQVGCRSAISSTRSG